MKVLKADHAFKTTNKNFQAAMLFMKE